MDMAKKVHHLEAKNLVIELMPKMKIDYDPETKAHNLKYEMAYAARDADERDEPKEVNDDEVVFQTTEK